MEKSKFEFARPRMLDCVFSLNEGFSPDIESVSMPVNVKMGHNWDGKSTCAIVSAQITVGADSEELPFKLETTFQAEFRWEEDAFPMDVVESLLKKNAAVLLLSYARPAISLITGFSGLPSYDLPYLDLNKE